MGATRRESIVEKYGLLQELLDSLRGRNAKQLQSLVKELVEYDPLTGLLNRNSLETKLNEEIARAARHKRPLSAIMADIDYFGNYNNTYGHSQGDRALRHVADILSRQRRTEDSIFRYGGEEFLMLLPETDKKGAINVANNILQRIRSTKIDEYVGPKGKSNLKYSGKNGFQDVRLSLGISTYPSVTKEPNLLISTADMAMYSAKKSGRDRFKVYK